MIEKLDGMTKDLVKENVEKLKELFPSIVKEDKIDFEELELLLGEDINRSKEQYSFVWNGKTEATKLAQKRSTGTLRPCIEESKDWDTTKNIYIEGDNLEVLKLLQTSYNGRIKMIYIDPPYNTGHDFVYKDNFEDNIANYKEITGQAQKSNADTDGRYHTNWLNMMYPRLKLARNLLDKDGVIFISIDDNEQANLKKICDDIFGENNFVASMVWKSKSGGANDVSAIATDSENILVYCKSLSNLKMNLDTEAEVTTSYNLVDEDGRRYGLDRLDKQSLGYHAKLDFPITGPDGRIYVVEHINPNNKVARWRWGQETVKERYNELVFKYPYVYTKNYEKEGIIPRNLLIEDRFGRTRTGKTEVADLFNKVTYFDFPKPTKLIRFLLKIATNKDSIILDFFSGSATTAHAVMQLNAEDGGNRKFICVQLPEKTEEDGEAFKAGYKNICEIGKERIRRAGENIKKFLKTSGYNYKKLLKEGKPYCLKDGTTGLSTGLYDTPKNIEEINKQIAENLDIGFKVFKLDTSNLKKWNNAPTKDANEVAKRIQLSLDYLESDRTELDLVYEIMLKYGLDLTLPITKSSNEKAFIVNGEEYKLLICSEMNLTLDDIESFANESVGTYLFADRCFADDNLLINTQEILKSRNKEMRLF